MKKKSHKLSPPEEILGMVRLYRQRIPLDERNLEFVEPLHCGAAKLIPKYPKGFHFGLCGVIHAACDIKEFDSVERMHAKKAKLKALLKYVKKHKPQGLSIDKDALVSDKRFFWYPGDWEARVAWLKEMIKFEEYVRKQN